ncbi:MAG: hypothetical protein U0822_13730 [Anaerolineae bacterium]
MSGSSSSRPFNLWDWNIRLREVLSADFDDETLRRISAALGVDWDTLPGADRPQKARSLIEAAARANRIDDLIAAGKRERPGEPWDAIADGAHRFPLVLAPAAPAARAPATPPSTESASSTATPAPHSPSASPPPLPAAGWSRGGSMASWREFWVMLGIVLVLVAVIAVACVALSSLANRFMADVNSDASDDSAVVSPSQAGGSNAPPSIVTAMAAAGATAIAKYGTPTPSPPGAKAYPATGAYPSPAAAKGARNPLAGFAAIMTDTQGRQHRVAASSLRWQSMNEIRLDGNREIPLNTVRAIDVTRNEPTPELRITLANGETVTGEVSAGCGFAGDTAIGPLEVPCGKLKRVEMTDAGGAPAPIPTRAVKGTRAVITDAQGRQTTVRGDSLKWSGIDEIWLDGGQTVRFDRVRAIDASVTGSTARLAITLANGEKLEDDISGSCRFGAESDIGPFEIACDRLKRIELLDPGAGPMPAAVTGRSLKGLTAVITDNQGAQTRAPADSLRWRGIGEVWLDSGQTLTFDRVRAIDVSGDQSQARMSVTLVNGETLEDGVTGGCWFNLQPAADVTLRCDQIRRIEIQ